MPKTDSSQLDALVEPLDVRSLLDSFLAAMPGAGLALVADGQPYASVGTWPDDSLEQACAGGEPNRVRLFPIEVGGSPIATLAVMQDEAGKDSPLSDALRRTMGLLLQQAVMAHEATSQSHSTEMRAMQLQIVMEITRELTGTLDLDKLLDMIMNGAVGILKAGAGSLFLIDEASGDLIFRVVTSGEANLIGTHIPAGKGIVGEAAATGKPVVVQNVEDTGQFFSELEHSGFQTHSLLAVPLRVPDRTLGVLELINKVDGSPFDPDDVELLTTFAAQAAIAIENARLYRSAIVKERLEHEARLAFDLQSSLIPSATPDLEGWQFAAWWQPAREVSGDFYDFILRADRLDMVLGDVADKGMHAAMFMALTRSTIRASLTPERSASESLTTANNLICADATGGMFVTLFYAALDLAARSLTYVNCGHNPPLLVRADTGALETLGRTGMVLGFDNQVEYSQVTCALQPGDVIALYTDGVTEAFSASGEQFGEERLRELVLAHHQHSAEEILDALKNALTGHTGQTPQSDDITALIAKCV